MGGKFIPKAKSKLLPRKEISTSEHASSCNDGKNEHASSASGNILNNCSNPVDSTPDTSAKEFLKSSHSSPVEIQVLDTTNPDLENFQQVNVKGDNLGSVVALHSTTASEVNSDWNSSNFSKATNEVNAIFDYSLSWFIVTGAFVTSFSFEFILFSGRSWRS